MLKLIELDEPNMKINAHMHDLSKHPPDINNGWNCDKLAGATKCLTGLTAFYQSKGIPGYRCQNCNYDLCEKCMRADIFISIHGNRED
jgi:hypothetical protein